MNGLILWMNTKNISNDVNLFIIKNCLIKYNDIIYFKSNNNG